MTWTWVSVNAGARSSLSLMSPGNPAVQNLVDFFKLWISHLPAEPWATELHLRLRSPATQNGILERQWLWRIWKYSFITDARIPTSPSRLFKYRKHLFDMSWMGIVQICITLTKKLPHDTPHFFSLLKERLSATPHRPTNFIESPSLTMFFLFRFSDWKPRLLG